MNVDDSHKMNGHDGKLIEVVLATVNVASVAVVLKSW